jgi:hypothetical protein
VLLVALVRSLALNAQNPAPRAQQQATPAWLAADRATLAKETYTVPPAEIRRMVEVPWDLNVAFRDQSPTRKYFLNIREKEFPPLSAYGKPHLTGSLKPVLFITDDWDVFVAAEEYPANWRDLPEEILFSV